MAQKKTQSSLHTEQTHIVVKGARTHNLKNIDVSMPRNTMIAVTGLSGSGKSSLAFDTIFAEGQRRYVESLSAYARQFLSQMDKPDVDDIKGLSPAISIDQKSRSNNPRSTVATITEIYDYLRVLYARVGRPYSPLTGYEIRRMTKDEIVHFVVRTVQELDTKERHNKNVMGVSWSEEPLMIWAPVVRGRKGEYYQMLYDALGRGYAEARIDGKVKSLRSQIVLAKNKKHDIDLLVDQFHIADLSANESDFLERLTEAIERAIEETDGILRMTIGDPNNDPEEHLFSATFISPEDGFSFPEIEPRLFSFNSPYGACQKCNGLGTMHLFGNEHDDVCPACNGARLRREGLHVLLGSTEEAEALAQKIENNTSSLPEAPYEKKWKRRGLNIYEFTQLSIKDAHEFVLSLAMDTKTEEVSAPLLSEIESRLQFLINVGLEYLSLNRRANTLSGGEAQRIRLASQLGSRLVGALYVLDEPTIGLHQHDNDRLIKTLTELRDLGNTIIVVEHDEDTVLASDYIIEIGPGAGKHGGEVIISDYLEPLLKASKNTNDSLTLAYLRGEKTIPVPEWRTRNKGSIRITGATIHNIKNQNVEVPLGKLVVISGVSGSGKSSFLYDVLHTNLRARYDRRYRSARTFNVARFEGDDSVSRSVLVSQAPIGRTPRSNPATYTGAWTYIRELFGSTEEARLRGWKAGRFSFNTKGGRCESCQGRGEIAVEMHFLPTVYVVCDVCAGKRFEKETLKVTYRGKSVHDILEMSIEEATEFFHDIPNIHDRMKTLLDVGLGYIELGQPANTLSGGESQRVKIASELYRPMTERTVYLLDEPTVGLHFEDVKRLIEILHTLVDRGNTVVTIEHNLDVIKSADHIIDFGPTGGEGGGKIVATGNPEDIAGNKNSLTGSYLKKLLAEGKKKKNQEK